MTKNACPHYSARTMYCPDNVTPYAMVCHRCDAIGVWSLGGANDDPEPVQIEIRAAALAHHAEWSQISWDEAHGMNIHAGIAMGNGPMAPAHHAGFLAREIATFSPEVDR